jgi:hypothetical protein
MVRRRDEISDAHISAKKDSCRSRMILGLLIGYFAPRSIAGAGFKFNRSRNSSNGVSNSSS